MNFCIYGAGYVGMSIASILAVRNQVTLFDTDLGKIININSGISPIVDVDIERHLPTVMKNIFACTESVERLVETDYVIICVPTNFDDLKQRFNTEIIDKLIRKLNELRFTKPIIIKSTVPIGYTQNLQSLYPSLEIIFSPEFLREGKALYDQFNPSRIIMGSDSETARCLAAELTYLSSKLNVDTIYTDNTTAEAIKLSANSYLAMRVAFFNEVDSLSMSLDLDTKALIHGISLDERIGAGYNNPSFGYGGYCLPKDVRQLKSSMIEFGVANPLIAAINKSNQQRIELFAQKVVSSGAETVGIYRVQMKSGSDNLRESVSMKICQKLLHLGLKIIIYEPKITLSRALAELLEPSFENFVKESDMIIANRWAPELECCTHKVITRDIYHEH